MYSPKVPTRNKVTVVVLTVPTYISLLLPLKQIPLGKRLLSFGENSLAMST